eukprot:superscaffoldBa00001433_g10516
MIGGLFPIHESVEMTPGEDGRETWTCDRFSNARLVQSLIMVHAVEEISYGSTAGILSDKTRFPSFMRTVPEDDHQARVIMEIVEKNQWTWVGVVITDSDAGRYARDRLQHYAKDKDICFAFVSVLPEVLSDSELKDSINATIEDITKNEKVKLREALKRATFHMDGRNYAFNERGDLNSGYEVILWRNQSTSVDVRYIVATYDIENKMFTFISPKTRQDFQNVTRNVTSRCSDTCKVGYVKKSSDHQPVCCYECNPCPKDYFSNTTGSHNCTLKKPVFLKWNDEYHIVLLTVTALGALLTLIVGIIFLARWNTPVVRASVGPICILLLLSLLSTFVSVILFGGEPNRRQCQARQVLFGFSFTLCVSCIMVKSFKIILAFEFDPDTKRILKKLYQPYIIIAVCLSGQVIICAVWLALKPPTPKWKQTSNKKMRLHFCDETFFPAFGAMLGYIGVLAFICLGVAFKGRNLPHSYNDARFITFSMLIYFISWIIFGPVYVNVE